MRRSLPAAALASVLILCVACSANQATSNVGTLDQPARRACGDLKAVIQARSTGILDARELQGQIAQVYAEAATSANPIMRARAVALFADATQLAAGAEAGSLDRDLQAMDQLCAGAGV